VAEGAVPTAQPGADTPEEPSSANMMGLTLSPLNPELRGQLELDDGAMGLVVTDVDNLSDAYEKGVRAGDLITEAGQQKIASVSDLDDRVAEAQEAGRTSILLLVRRAGEPRFVALPIDSDD